MIDSDLNLKEIMLLELFVEVVLEFLEEMIEEQTLLKLRLQFLSSTKVQLITVKTIRRKINNNRVWKKF